MSKYIGNLTIRKRNPRVAGNNPYNSNYKILKEKLMQKRARRQEKKRGLGKKALALPLEMIGGEEQRKANAKGNLILLDGVKRVTIPLVTMHDQGRAYLQGAYKLPTGELVALRSLVFQGKPALQYFFTSKGREVEVASFFDRINDIAHNLIFEQKLEGTGLGVRAAAKSEKEYRAIGGKQPILVAHSMKPLYTKMHYFAQNEGPFIEFMQKKGKAYLRDDMQKNHVIEAIDPITGKLKTFTFPLK